MLRCRHIWREGPSTEPSPCLPNPGYRPPPASVVEVAREQVATTADELSYWLDRASGRTSPDDPGWYFTGRRELTTQVAEFLRTGTGMLVITGAAGTGKSAIIARTVTLSDPTFRASPHYAPAIAAAPPDTIPPVSSVDLAVLARNKTTEEITEQLLVAAGGTPGPSADTVSRTSDLRRDLLAALPTDRPVTIVIDGLDEATRPATTVADLIGPLLRHATAAGDPRVRLIIGVRSPTPSQDGDTTNQGLLDLLARFRNSTPVTELRTDGPGTVTDVASYLRALLDTDDAALVDRIAAAAAPSFLDARFAGQRLRALPRLPAADDPELLASLADGTIGLLRDDLADTATAEHPAPVLLAVLRASAFALGAGVPWADIWPAMAGAILDDTVPDATVAHVLDSRLAGYLTHDTADGRIVYRPVHEALTDVLRDQPHRLTGDPRDC